VNNLGQPPSFQGGVVVAGSVEKTPNSQLPALAPGAARLTKSLWFENEATLPSGLVAATDRPIPRPPLLPPTAAAGNSSGFPFSALLPDAATGSTSLKKAASRARACDSAKPWPARLMLRTSAPRRIENSMPLMRSERSNSPLVEARTAITLVVPATPLPPATLPSRAAISPVTKVPWPTKSVTSALPEPVSTVRAI
jgi:hypothetical protein